MVDERENGVGRSSKAFRQLPHFPDSPFVWGGKRVHLKTDAIGAPSTHRVPVNTDYKISKRDVREISGADLLPAEFRLLTLRRYEHEYGTEALLSLFAEFIGLANSVVANNREFIEEYAIRGCGLDQSQVEQLNLPTIHGALNGILNAVEPVEGMCGDCAYRLGTCANQSPVTSVDAADAVSEYSGFNCHLKPSPEDDKLATICASYKAARKAAR